jgi:hypothetical protein
VRSARLATSDGHHHAGLHVDLCIGIGIGIYNIGLVSAAGTRARGGRSEPGSRPEGRERGDRTERERERGGPTEPRVHGQSGAGASATTSHYCEMEAIDSQGI